MKRLSTSLRWLTLGAMTVAFGCGGETPIESEEADAATTATLREVDPPAVAGSFAPSLSGGESDALLTWWERLPAPQGERRHRLMFARFDGEWSEARVVSEGEDYFANWADLPGVIREPSGALLAHWLEKTAEDTFAYSIFLARSTDDGATWKPLGKLNDDSTDTEHGFVSIVDEGDSVRAYWLDGRRMADGGPMTVRSALIGDRIGSSELLDDRVCECCPTDAVETADGSLVAFRNRSQDETREIHSVRRAGGSWSESAAVTADRWKIPGCPVNGPAIGVADGRLAMAWYTGAEDAPRVAVGFSAVLEGDFEGGLETVAVVDAEAPLGRVGLVLDDSGEAIASWFAVDGSEAELRLRRVAASGSMGEALPLGRTHAGRSSGVPQLERLGDSLVAAWVEVVEGHESVIRMRQLSLGAVPAVVPMSGGAGEGG